MNSMSRNPCALIIEDDATYRQPFTSVLRGMGVDSEWASSEPEAKGLMECKKYDLIILDLALDDSVGFTFSRQYFCEMLRRNHPETPIVAITGRPLTAQQGFLVAKCGADEFFLKGTMTIDDFRQCVQRFLFVEREGKTVVGTRALGRWKEKLRYLLHEEAITAGPEQKFELRARIEEAKAKIEGLENEAARKWR